MDMKMKSFSFTSCVSTIKNSMYDDAVDEWVQNQDKQTIRNMVRNGQITISEYEKITGENY